jgi:hypothetical protein
MCKRFISFAIVILLLHFVTAIPSTSAATDAQKQARYAEKVKAGIVKLGAGKEARVAVRLRDKTKLAGYISEIREDSFAITDPNTDAITVVTWPNVKQVKGHNLSTGAKIAIIGLGIAVAVLGFLLWFENYD